MKYLLSISIALLFCAATVAQNKPNVIVIVADDLGNADVGYHNQDSKIPTPNIDLLASKGVKFSAGYVTAPVCGPSRAGILTGCNQQRFGFDDNPGPFRSEPGVLAGIPLDIPIIPEYLKPEGYATACIGKWHVGHESDDYFPTRRGFDYFYGFLGGAASYYPNNNEGRTLFKNEKPVLVENEYITDAFGREAVEYINSKKDEPFFMYLAFNAVHGPLQEPPAVYQEPFKNMPQSKRRTLCAMQYAMDANVGRVVEALEKNNISENTLIFFVSDNGGKIKGNYSYNMPYKGEKGTLYEGGIRLPFFVVMPNDLPNNKTFSKPISTIDILPTVLSVASIETNSHIDGKDLTPFLKSKKEKDVHEYIYWRINQRWSIRNANYKLVCNDDKKRPELYHISKDISETKDLYNELPEIAAMLQKEYDRWSNEVGEPMWGWNPRVGKNVKHPEETFENIHVEQVFKVGKNTLIDIVNNPKKQNINQSNTVLEINNTNANSLGMSMKVPQFLLKRRFLKFKVLVDSEYSLTATLKNNKTKEDQIINIERSKENKWQEISIDYSKYKKAVNSIILNFNSDQSKVTEHKIFIDDIRFSD
ncbi:sulfatase-like hydrolase/transferase [Saccharicrinis aurantiacus]|uniref:sulfatase-like hydrolase/transferase n=1 Tax=Saccharicrinis aurantiacus TaxID=1849719 RepID=UPI00248FC7B0|nr:sulfatase-like hydrolase/transferase [Saccharicrinis aurantiacus]